MKTRRVVIVTCLTCFGYMYITPKYKRESVGMAAATTNASLQTRANLLCAAFELLERDATAGLIQHMRLVGSNDARVASWMLSLRLRLDSSREWINDLRRQTTHHNFMEQADHFENIQRAVQEAGDTIRAFDFVVTPEHAVQALNTLRDCVHDLNRNFGAWASNERHKNSNPQPREWELDAMRHRAEMPPARRDSAQRQHSVNEDVNPEDNLARTYNPCMIM